MILYLQFNYNSNMVSLAEKNEHKSEDAPFDYYTLEDLPKDMTIYELNKYVMEKYNCKKLIIQL